MPKKLNLTGVSFDEIPAYSDILKKLSGRPQPMHLLIGNGFSMAYDYKIFSYNALYDFIDKLSDPVLQKLFQLINTKNFELVMRQLDNFIEIAEAFSSDSTLVEMLKSANAKLQSSLIDAVSSLHPEHVFTIGEESCNHCFAFLNEYIENGGKIFSTNYDLLLYWVLIRKQAKNAIDGFGREMLNPEEAKTGEEPVWSDLYWGKNKSEQSVYYVHGTLPIFDTGIEIEKEVYTSEHYLLENIKERLKKKEYPIFVTAGNGKEKLNHIMHNRYLTYCYEQLCNVSGSVVSFGFNFGEYDEHIIDALNKAAAPWRGGDKLLSIYIGLYSKEDLDYIKSIEHKFKCKVNVYSSKSANVWS